MVEKYLKHHMTSPESSMKQVLGQLIKSCHLVIYNAIFLADKNTALQITN